MSLIPNDLGSGISSLTNGKVHMGQGRVVVGGILDIKCGVNVLIRRTGCGSAQIVVVVYRSRSIIGLLKDVSIDRFFRRKNHSIVVTTIDRIVPLR
jgi:hypothetical protein